MERILDDNDTLPTWMTWASWDFYPSPWNGGTLLGNCADHEESPFVALAAPGASLCGESGFGTARWRRASWPTVAAFFNHEPPQAYEVVGLDYLCAELPEDFSEWAVRSTAAQIERLASCGSGHLEEPEATDLIDTLQTEVEDAYPGALECAWASEALPSFAEPSPTFTLRGRLIKRFPAYAISRRQASGLLAHAALFGALYVLYRLLRDPEPPVGAKVEVQQVAQLPIGEFAFWLYGIGHILVPGAFFGWLYLQRHSAFATARNSIVLASSITVAAYLIYSPQAVYAVSTVEAVPASALPAMPAFHLVIALGMAIFGIRLSSHLATKLFWGAYPVVVASILAASDSLHLPETIAFAAGVTALSLLLVTTLLPLIHIPTNVPWHSRS